MRIHSSAKKRKLIKNILGTVINSIIVQRGQSSLRTDIFSIDSFNEAEMLRETYYLGYIVFHLEYVRGPGE